MAGSNNRTVQVNIVGDSSKLSSAMQKAGDDSVTATGRISKAWGGVASSIGGAFGSALQPALDVLNNLGGTVGNLHKSVGSAMVGIGGAGLAAGGALSVFGSKEQAAQQQLAQAFDNVGQNVGDYQDRIDKSVGSMTKFGYTGDQVKDALTKLVTATKDPKRSLDLLTTAANLAALKHVDLGTATEGLVKVISGKGTRTLSELGIQMGKTGKSGYDVEKAIKAIADRTNGQANAAADTYSGKLKAIRAEIENQVASFGQKYGPAIQAAAGGMALLGGATETVSALMSKFKTADEAVTAAEGVKTAAEAADAAADDAVAASEVAAEAPLLPIIAIIALIVAAVAAVGFGIYELATHWSEVWNGIKDVCDAVWQGIDSDFIQPLEGFFSGIVDFVKQHWQDILLVLTGPIGLALDFITGNKGFGGVVSFFENVPGEIEQALSTIGKALADPFIYAINGIIDAWNWLMDHFKIPGFHLGPIGWDGVDLGKGLKIGNIPYLAEGGIVTGPTLAMLGDNRSGTEAVVPLEKAGQHGFGGGQGGGDIVLVLDGKELARSSWPYIQTQALQSGRNARRVGLA